MVVAGGGSKAVAASTGDGEGLVAEGDGRSFFGVWPSYFYQPRAGGVVEVWGADCVVFADVDEGVGDAFLLEEVGDAVGEVALCDAVEGELESGGEGDFLGGELDLSEVDFLEGTFAQLFELSRRRGLGALFTHPAPIALNGGVKEAAGFFVKTGGKLEGRDEFGGRVGDFSCCVEPREGGVGGIEREDVFEPEELFATLVLELR